MKRWGPRSRLSVYPRVCGGTLATYTPERSDHRSIPACAGEPYSRYDQRNLADGVYPRVCGGTLATEHKDRTTSLSTGLSPRVRGNLRQNNLCRVAKGSIPACAGEPMRPVLWTPLPTVYPRVCGGTHAGHSTLRPCSEVYPRVCGGTFHRSPPRIQPLLVGGLSPRVRGNLPFWPPKARDNPLGLSPRVRGNPPTSSGIPAWSRSIPACAGEPRSLSCLRSLVSWVFTVYPRVCGGTP